MSGLPGGLQLRSGHQQGCLSSSWPYPSPSREQRIASNFAEQDHFSLGLAITRRVSPLQKEEISRTTSTFWSTFVKAIDSENFGSAPRQYLETPRFSQTGALQRYRPALFTKKQRTLLSRFACSI
ncbi:hypothetical protein H2248_000863 [Termitomyces sp. 'cryptogamus']|nr:hypothetical protein H2248_000863 [Termitomyces sp. 'cryptogamus']